MALNKFPNSAIGFFNNGRVEPWLEGESLPLHLVCRYYITCFQWSPDTMFDTYVMLYISDIMMCVSTTEQISEESIQVQIATQFRKLHRLQVGKDRRPKLWYHMNMWLSKAMDISFPNDKNNQERLVAINLDKIKTEVRCKVCFRNIVQANNIIIQIVWLKTILDTLNSPIVFTHGDLNRFIQYIFYRHAAP